MIGTAGKPVPLEFGTSVFTESSLALFDLAALSLLVQVVLHFPIELLRPARAP